MSEQEGTVLEQLQPFLDPTLETSAIAPQATQVALDDHTIALARQAARQPWYASWVTAAMIPGGPVLALVMGLFGGGTDLVGWAGLAIVLLVIFGPVIAIIWLAVHWRHRDKTEPIRNALGAKSGWAIQGPIAITGFHTIVAGGMPIDAVHRVSVPDWARTAVCTVVFARDNDADLSEYGREHNRGVVISIAGPDGRQIYPAVGEVPTLLQGPSLIASILISIAFTAACNAQSQTYANAAAYLRDIKASTPCTAQSKPGDDCWQWVAGTITLNEWKDPYQSKSTTPTSSICKAILRWGNHTQAGDVRSDVADCTQELDTAPMPAKLDVLKDYVIQVQVGDATYQTDRWPPLGDSVFTLALIFKVVTVLWVAWPIAHLAWSVGYRIWRTSTGPSAIAPSPPEPAQVEGAADAT